MQKDRFNAFIFISLIFSAFIINAQEFIRVEGGSFIMGCEEKDKDCYPDERPAHKVSVSTFEIGKYEVTVKEYKAFCQATKRPMPKTPPFGWVDNYPIVNVTWQDAMDYAKWKGCRLPTEAEWEFAARGGNKSQGYIYSGSNNFDEVAWSYENSDKKPHPVGQKKPNELGIYDMSGNAWEWCMDNYEVFYYEVSPVSDPKGPDTGLGKVNRGGCFTFDKALLNVHHRRCSDPTSIGTATGFRLARDVK